MRLIPPQYVKPYVKRGKNDRVDAEVICEAARRPGMRFVPVKSAEKQAAAMVLRVRDRLVGQRTQLINALRGHAAEFDVVAARGTTQMAALMARLAAEALIPKPALRELSRLARRIADLDTEIGGLDAQLREAASHDEMAHRLMKVPEIGPMGR